MLRFAAVRTRPRIGYLFSASLAFASPAALIPHPDEAVVRLGEALALDCPAVDIDLLNLLVVSGLVLGTPPLDFSL